MSPEFKSCPFCGCASIRMRDRAITRWGQTGVKFMLQCAACQAQTGLKETEADAIACWNMRHNSTYEGAEDE